MLGVFLLDPERCSVDTAGGLEPDLIRSVLNTMCSFYNGLNICHINAGSLRSKYTILRQMFSNSRMDVVMVSESWLNSNVTTNLVAIPGFNLLRNDRKDRMGGGVCMYVKENICSKTIYSSSLSPIEFLCVEAKNESEKYLLVTVYSPPCKFKEENIKELEDTLIRLSTVFSRILIGGDFNVNILGNNAATRLLYHLCDLVGLEVVNKILPTCFQSDQNPSLIDMFLVKSRNQIVGHNQLGLTSDFNHDLIYCSLDFQIPRFSTKQIRYKAIQKTDLNNLQQNINDLGLNNIYNTASLDLKVSILSDIINDIYETYVPVVTKVLRTQNCPWFTPQIKMLIMERERFYKKFKRIPSDFNRRQFTYARNRVSNAIRNTKRAFFTKQLDTQLNPKTLWKNLRSVGVIDGETPKCPFNPNDMAMVLVPDSCYLTPFG